jgi:hypothetical protein
MNVDAKVMEMGDRAQASKRAPRPHFNIKAQKGRYKIKDDLHLAVSANTNGLDWTDLRYFRDMLGDIIPLDASTSLLSIDAFSTPEGRLFIAKNISQLESERVHFFYPQLADYVSNLDATIEACRTPHENDVEILDKISRREQLLLVLFVVLESESKIVFVLESALRLMPQHLRTIILNSFEGRRLIVWQSVPSAVVVLPSPKHRLLLNNDGVHSVVSGKVPTTELDQDVQDAIFRKRFLRPKVEADENLEELDE